MKVFSVYGSKGTGKTSTVENIIKELKKRQYRVGSVKDIHFKSFTMETEGSNTHRHYTAGADLVTARGFEETNVLYKGKLGMSDILNHYKCYDFVILEGVEDLNCPKILTARTSDDITQRIGPHVIAISGVIANNSALTSWEDIPVFNGCDNTTALVDFILEKSVSPFPDFDEKCCGECGANCEEFLDDFLHNEQSLEVCQRYMGKSIQLVIDGEDVPMVPFVQRVLENNIRALVKELKGYKDGANITVSLKEEGFHGNTSDH